MNRQRQGFTLIEIMIVVVILSLLITAGAAAWLWFKRRGEISASTSNLHLLATANLAYATEHGGSYCPAQDRKNLRRWHGSRKKTSEEFQPEGGFLTPYLGNDQRVKTCPLLKQALEGRSSFEDGAGGYGYNAAYVGGTPEDHYTAANLSDVPHPGRTVMFATTGFAKEEGIQEYPFAEPFYAPEPHGGRGYDLQPSVHFRAAGKALVAWCDGRVTQEEPSTFSDTNFYGGDNKKSGIGWFGPEEENGYWNPNSPAAQGKQP